MNEPTHLDLFSGIGGFALAAQWAGFRTIGFCEIDKYCQKVLAKNFPNTQSEPYDAGTTGEGFTPISDRKGVPIICDIRSVLGEDFRCVSLITGGFPCQPFSVAGKRRGAADDRAIWPEMFRVINEARPAWVLGENVPGIIPMELDNVLSDLEGIGYATRSFVIPACAVDARHRRDRLWIVAKSISNINQRAERGGNGISGTMAELNRAKHSSTGKPCRAGKQVGRQTMHRHEISDTGSAGLEGVAETGNACGSGAQREEQSTGFRREQEMANSEHKQFNGGRRAWDWQPESSDCCQWLPEPDVGRVVDGLSLELDFARQITAHEHSHRSEKKSERNILVWKLLRAMWEHRELAEASPELYIQRLQDSVPEVPLQDSQSRWLLGSRIENRQGLRDLWCDFYSKGLASAQDLQFKLLEQARQVKREQTLGNRVNRLKGLGNAIVPQVAYEILREIRKLI